MHGLFLGAALGKLSVTFDDMLADIDAVLGFLRDRVLPELGIKANGVALGGCSAGAHLALVAAARDRHPLPLAMVYAQVPPADLLHPRFKEAQPYFRLLAKGDVRRYSPVELVRRGTPPAVVASMGCDELVPAENFHRLTNAYHRAGVEVSASLTPGCGHGDMPRGLEADVVRRINRMALRTGLLRKSEVECRSGRTMNARSCRRPTGAGRAGSWISRAGRATCRALNRRCRRVSSRKTDCKCPRRPGAVETRGGHL